MQLRLAHQPGMDGPGGPLGDFDVIKRASDERERGAPRRGCGYGSRRRREPCTRCIEEFLVTAEDMKRLKVWRAWRDLNPRPAGSKPDALSTELHARGSIVRCWGGGCLFAGSLHLTARRKSIPCLAGDQISSERFCSGPPPSERHQGRSFVRQVLQKRLRSK